MKTAIIIPARMASTRLPGKPLKLIGADPMIVHVARQARKVNGVDEVWVATDHVDIASTVQYAGFKFVMTKPSHETGTDRLAEANLTVGADYVINIQGDEPFIDPLAVEKAIMALKRKDAPEISTLATRFKDPEEMYNPNHVKVIVNSRGDALYFSRSKIPFARDAQKTPEIVYPYLRHIGLYGYRADALRKLASFPKSVLEQTEKLEQLRALYYGFRIAVVETDSVPLSVDTPEDLQIANNHYSHLVKNGL